MSKNDFFFPRARYYGEFSPENLIFDANLQEFSQRVSIISSLETGGKIQPEDAFYQIKDLMQQLQDSGKELGVISRS